MSSTSVSPFTVWFNRTFDENLSLARKLSVSQLIKAFNFVIHESHPSWLFPERILNKICRKSIPKDSIEDLKVIMNRYNWKFLWKQALTPMWSWKQAPTPMRSWSDEAISCLSLVYPVHENDFWPICYLLRHKDFGSHRQNQVFKLITAKCSRDPFTSESVRNSLLCVDINEEEEEGCSLMKNIEFAHSCLDNWSSEPPVYSEIVQEDNQTKPPSYDSIV